MGSGRKESALLVEYWCPRRGHLESEALVLTEVSVSRDPKTQVMTTMSTNHSRRLAQMCGNSSSTAVITPSRPAN